MSALEAERTLARLYTDAGFRHAFLRDAAHTLAPLDLTAEEKADLAGIDRAGLVMAAASYQHKRTRYAALRRGAGSRLAKLIRAAMRACSVVVFAVISLLLWAPLHAQEMIVGVNVVNPLRAHVPDQNTLLAQLKAADVRVIRCGISNDEKGIDFAKRAAAQGIRIQLIIGPQYSPNAPTRAYQPNEFPAMWGGPPLSSADAALSKTAFQHLFDGLDANGITLAGVELGNEINWAAFNPEFPLPGEGKILSLEDLAHDPEGKQIAKGFLRYIEVLAVLKDVRNHSRLNRSAPIISAGLVSAKDGETLYNNKKEDMVSLAAAIAFLRAHGLDSLVDAYGVHSYPSPGQPGNPTAAGQLTARLNSVDLAECRAKGTAGGKPCWITEWGFPNTNLSCPGDENARTLLIEELRGDFAAAAAEHRLVGIDYFSWDSDPWSKQPDADSVYRCGALTESGREAVAAEGQEQSFSPSDSIRVRVGVPLVARGPAPNIADNDFTEIELPNGKFRGFTAAGTTFAVDGKEPYDMGGPAVTVLKPGPSGSPDACGQWLQHVELKGTTLFGWIHNETACDYAKYGQTHARMTIATSTDYGHNWKVEGPIIVGTDPPAANKETGDSCISVIVMTAPDPKQTSVELEECINKWPGHPDRILIQKGVCETQDYRRLRSAGFIYATSQPNSQPLYRCYSDSEKAHFAANDDACKGMGRREALLGYDLKQ